MDGLNYSVTVAGLEQFGLFPNPLDSAVTTQNGQRGGDYKSPPRSEPPETGNGPTRSGNGARAETIKKSRYSERQQRLRGLLLREFARNHYLTPRNLSGAVVKITNTLLGHLARCRGETHVRDVRDELLWEMKDYFSGLIADGELGANQANKNLRTLKAIGNCAATMRLIRGRLTFNDFLATKNPEPKALALDDLWKINRAAQAVRGFVGDARQHGYEVPARLWWPAWYLTMSRVGNRLTAMMLSERRDYQHGVLHLRAENQKQDEDQRMALPDYVQPAVEDLLAAHDQARIFPWPFDQPKTGQPCNWKTLSKHFRQKLLQPAGITLPKGVLTRVFRRTAGSMVESLGGSGSKLLGHSNPSVFKKFYQDKSMGPITKDACLIPADRPPAPPQGEQKDLFQWKDEQ